jgi:hypothetical protein
VIYSTRHLRRGLRACLRAGIGLGQVSPHSALSAPQLQRMIDGGFPWATRGGAEAVLAGLPPAIERAVREPTYRVLPRDKGQVCRRGFPYARAARSAKF